MKKIKDQIEHSKLLVGKVLDSLDEEQEQALSDWEKSDQNKKAEKDILNSEAFKSWNEKKDAFDTSQSWERYLNKMEASKPKGKSIKFSFYKQAIAIAASVVLLVSIGLLFFMDEFTQDEVVATATDVVKPGEFKATLTLSNGEKVRLTDHIQDSITDKGHSIQHDVDAGLNYTNDSQSARSKRKLVYNTLKVARGEEYKIVLADGTQVWLNADSELKYPIQFHGEQRSVYLKGEAYFDVAHNKNKKFVVNSHDQQVNVYGTEFCIDAYNEKSIKTVLVEGSIGLKANKQVAEVKLKPGELGTANSSTGDTKVEKVNVRPYTAWKDGVFVFQHEKLESIMMKLERWYNVKVFYMNEECKDFTFTGDVKRYADIESLLKLMQRTSKVKFEVKKNTIVVMARE